MSAPRFLAAATVVIVGILCAPAALTPGINSADLIVIAAPISLLAVAWPRGRHPRRSGRLHRLPPGAPSPPLAPTSPTSSRPRRVSTK